MASVREAQGSSASVRITDKLDSYPEGRAPPTSHRRKVFVVHLDVDQKRARGWGEHLVLLCAVIQGTVKRCIRRGPCQVVIPNHSPRVTAQ